MVLHAPQPGRDLGGRGTLVRARVDRRVCRGGRPGETLMPDADRQRRARHASTTITCLVEPTSTQAREIRFPRDMIRWEAENDVAIAGELALAQP
jgi:hypothetical protein